MIARMVHHRCNPQYMEKSRQHVDRVGEVAAITPGFVCRLRLDDPNDPSVIITMTVWEEPDSLKAFQKSQEATGPSEYDDYFIRVQAQLLDVASAKWQSPSPLDGKRSDLT